MQSNPELRFLGFTHVWGKSRKGKNVVWQYTAKDRYAKALKALNEWCRTNRHWSIEEQHEKLKLKMQGHYAYYRITGNNKRLQWYAYQVRRIWQKWLSRRNRNGSIRWECFSKMLQRYPLPQPRIIHQYTNPSEAAS